MNDPNDHAGADLQQALQVLRDELCRQAPGLCAPVAAEIEDRGGGYHILHFRCQDRACVIEAAGDGVTHAAFLWDDRPLFASGFDAPAPLATLLRRWVADRAMPSSIQAEHPELEIDPLAAYYERGIPLAGEFVRSWDAIEEFYREDGGEHFAAARTFIRTLRQAGYDQKLRAGQSMSIMGLSRSRDQGLHDDQPRLWFAFDATTMDVDANFGSGGLKQHPIQLTSTIRQLLDTLADQELA